MKTSVKKDYAVVKKTVELSTIDMIAIGAAFAPFKELIEKQNKYDKYYSQPYDKQDTTEVPDSPKAIPHEVLVHAMKNIMVFIDKIAIYPTASNVFMCDSDDSKDDEIVL